MDMNKLHALLGSTTVQLRKGAEVEKRAVGSVDVTEVYAMPAVSEATGDLELVDMEFLVIGVLKAKAEQHRAALVALLNAYPQPERLASGPSYIEVGGVIGDQGAAFQLFALGKVLGLWSVITPHALGATGEEARQMAGAGYIMITGYSKRAEDEPA